MCGIAGYVGHGNEDILVRMTSELFHRGPNFQDYKVVENVGFGHTRLSIIDLDSRSNQPFFSSDSRYVIVFNGEIYNYLSLKKDLKSEFEFRTRSDTEVLLFACIKYGKNVFDKLDGMFAFAFFDFQTKSLLIGRDRFGKKPIYYTLKNDTLIFASELKSLRQYDNIGWELDIQALNEYLTMDYVPSPRSIIKGISKLPAGHYLCYEHGNLEIRCFWDHEFKIQDIEYNEAKEELDKLLSEAVRKRLMSDVPLGVFLSGGLDSSTIAYYAQMHSSIKVKTFSIGFNERSYDESQEAREVSESLGTEHYEEILTAEKARGLIPRIYSLLDEPFADPSIIPSYYLCGTAQKKITVALGGDGTDELMAGYPTFMADKWAGFLDLFPKWTYNLMGRVTDMFPGKDRNLGLDFKIKQFLKGVDSTALNLHPLWLSSFTPKDKQHLFAVDIYQNLQKLSGLEFLNAYKRQDLEGNRFAQIQYVYYKTYLQDDILVKMDRASMFNSLEVRSPFLDIDLVNFLNGLQVDYKFKHNRGKRLLRSLMQSRLPQNVLNRSKKGFGIPVSLWLRKDFKPLLKELLSKERIKSQGLFNYPYLEKMLKEHDSGKVNHRKLIWNLLVFQIWHDEYLK